MTQQDKKNKRPNKIDLHFLVYTLSPELFTMLLPYEEEDRYELIAEIIDAWEKIRS